MRAVAAILAAGAGLCLWAGGGRAAADPGPPVEPALPVPPTQAGPALAPSNVLGDLRVDPLAALGGLMAASPQAPVLGLAPLPPDTVSSGPGADPLAFTQLLLPQNFRMPAAEQTSPYPLAPNDTPSPFARIDAWKGVHALTHGGLGRMPGEDLGQALPGTAAPPGVNLPPGLEQFYVDPAAAPPPPA